MNALVGKIQAVTTVPAPLAVKLHTNDGLKDGGFYWIERKMKSSGTKVKEIAMFHKSPTNRSLYEGKWEIFGRISKEYHTKDIKVLCEIEKPRRVRKAS